MEVGVEAAKPGGIHEHFSTLETVPVSIGFGFGYAVVYPPWWDIVREFVVENCLEGGDDLRWALKEET